MAPPACPLRDGRSNTVGFGDFLKWGKGMDG